MLRTGKNYSKNKNCVKGCGATNWNVDARANIVTMYTDRHCILQSVQYQLRVLDK